MSVNNLPKLITFDGEARSGKGTIVQATKDYLRDECGYKVMLIDSGQMFRVLVVAATRAGIDVDDPEAIDAFLADEQKTTECVQLVKDVYHMSKNERDALLYTNEVGANSAKIGARPLSQEFATALTRKWFRDARQEGFEVILLDGRALEEIGIILEDEGLCDFVAGFYFICDPIVGARRTLGHATKPYESLSETERAEVDDLVRQVMVRNEADRNRAVRPIVAPKDASRYELPAAPDMSTQDERLMVIFDTSANMTKSEMSLPVARCAAKAL